jgi:hypothetical protein
MERVNASVETIDDKFYIKIDFDDEVVRIPLSDDKANEVKSAFNKIILKIKAGDFYIHLDKVEETLFSQVANEYLIQLNREIKEVSGHMKSFGLVAEDPNADLA